MSQYSLRLDVVDGPLRGQVAVVGDSGKIVVGRLPDCGLAVTQDLTVSRQHFQIELQSGLGRLTHLSQTGETFVNGTSVSKVELRTGDEIAFGDGNRIRAVFFESHESTTPTMAEVPPAPSYKSAKSVTVTTVSCGWSLYESVGEQPDFAALLDLLMGSQNVNAILDFRRLGIDVPKEILESHYLFGWMPLASRQQFSPAFASVTDNPKIAEIIRAGWCSDGIVCFGSKLKDSRLVTHWRTAIGAEGEAPGTALVAYYWPSILSLILTCQSPIQVDPLLCQLDWIFIENKKSPGKWQLYAKTDFSAILTKSGLQVSENVPSST